MLEWCRPSCWTRRAGYLRRGDNATRAALRFGADGHGEHATIETAGVRSRVGRILCEERSGRKGEGRAYKFEFALMKCMGTKWLSCGSVHLLRRYYISSTDWTRTGCYLISPRLLSISYEPYIVIIGVPSKKCLIKILFHEVLLLFISFMIKNVYLQSIRFIFLRIEYLIRSFA